ncbi:MAG: oligosaccharide flippase family protein [Gemmatimonadota bacterium]
MSGGAARGGAGRRVLLGSGWLLGGQTLATGLALIQGVLLARLLGPSGYGIVGLVLAFAALLSRFFDARSWETAVKYLTDYAERGDSGRGRAVLKGLLAVDLVSALLTCAALVAAAPLAARLFVQDPAAAGLVRIYALTVLGLAPFGMALGLLRIADRYTWMSGFQVLAALAELALTVGTVVSGGSLTALMWAFVAAAGLRTVGALWLLEKAAAELGFRGWLRAPLADARDQLREVAGFWASSNLFAVLKGVHQSIDTLLVGSFLGPAAAGVFRIAKNLSQAVSFPLNPLFQASYPELVRLHAQGDGPALARLYRRLLVGGALAAVGVGVGVALVAGPLVRWTAGPAFLDAVPVLRWMAAGVAFAAATQFGHALLLARRQLRPVFWSFALPLGVQVGVLAVALPGGDPVVAGWAFAAFAAVRGALLLASTRGALIRNAPPGT